MVKMLQEKKFLINELAKRAKTTVRTIRYYTSEGLLPQPETDGKYAYYNENHLRRLELILRLKEAFLPLKEIRQIMLSLTDEDVRQRLMEDVLPPQKEERKERPTVIKEQKSSDALDYISNLMETQSKFRSNEIHSNRPHIPRKEPDQYNQSALSLKPKDMETWQRIILAPGVEMHLRYPADSDTNNRVQQLIMFAKKIFRK